MKLQPSLICAIAVGISTGYQLTSCQSHNKSKHFQKVASPHPSADTTSTPSKAPVDSIGTIPEQDPCLACGMG